jgi:hypothetical protein
MFGPYLQAQGLLIGMQKLENGWTLTVQAPMGLPRSYAFTDDDLDFLLAFIEKLVTQPDEAKDGRISDKPNPTS